MCWSLPLANYVFASSAKPYYISLIVFWLMSWLNRDSFNAGCLETWTHLYLENLPQSLSRVSRNDRLSNRYDSIDSFVSAPKASTNLLRTYFAKMFQKYGFCFLSVNYAAWTVKITFPHYLRNWTRRFNFTGCSRFLSLLI